MSKFFKDLPDMPTPADALLAVSYLDDIKTYKGTMAQVVGTVVTAVAGSSQLIPGNGVETYKVAFDTIITDFRDEYDSTNYEFTATVGGFYYIAASVLWDEQDWTTNDRTELSIISGVGGTVYACDFSQRERNGTYFWMTNHVSAVLHLVVDQVIAVGVRQFNDLPSPPSDKTLRPSPGETGLRIFRIA